MQLPNWIYRSDRVGKNGKAFSVYKIRTMRIGIRTDFASQEVYTRFGRLLRKLKIDELLQIINVFKGEMALVGPRPDFQESYDLMPYDIKKTLLSVKPGCTSLASVHFFDEEMTLEKMGPDKYKNYFTQIKPAKILLDILYIQNRSALFDLAILWATFKKIIHATFTRDN